MVECDKCCEEVEERRGLEIGLALGLSCNEVVRDLPGGQCLPVTRAQAGLVEVEK